MAHKDGSKSGGRQKGVPNKKSLIASEIKEKVGVDPLEVLLLIAKGDWQALGYDSPTRIVATQTGPVEVPVISLEHRFLSAEKAAPYFYSKLQTHNVSVSGTMTHEVNNENVLELVQGFVSMVKELKEARAPVTVVPLVPVKKEE